MKRISLAVVATAAVLAVSPGVAYANSSAGGAGGAGGSSGGSSGTAGKSGTAGSSSSNCVGSIAIVLSWFGFPGTITQCK